MVKHRGYPIRAPLPQDARDVAAQLQHPWLAVYEGAQHGVLMQETTSALQLLGNFLENA